MAKFLKYYGLLLIVIVLLIAATVYFFWWHWQPFTQNAFLFANSRPVSPLVAGYITEIHVRNNQQVKKGAPLFTTFRPPYTLKVAELEHAIAEQQANVLGITAKINAATSERDKYQAMLANNKYLSEQAHYMYAGEAVSQAYAEERLRAREGSQSQVDAARHTITALTHDRAATIARIKQLEKQLELAKIYAEQTIVYALSDGIVTNMSITPGGYYHPGDVLFAFLNTDEWFVQANFKETELSEIRPGQTARIWLWQYPGKCFRGVVEAVGWNAERRRFAQETGVAVVEKENEWFLLPQRFPVQIRVLDRDPDCDFHLGASAYVEVETPARPIRQFFWQLFLW